MEHVEDTLVEGRAAVPVIRSVLTQDAVIPKGALHDLYVDGYCRGAVVGKTLVADLRKDDAEDAGGVASIDWSEWTPGDVETARALLGGLQDQSVLADLLDAADVQIKSISENRLDQLARAIADNIASGADNGDLAGVLAGILDDPSRAEMVANTETTRVITAGAMDEYAGLGVTWISFLSAEDAQVESRCNENEEHGAIPIWDDFPNGAPPVHPNCRCTIVPASGPNG